LPHELLLLEAVHSFPDRWRAVRSFGSDGLIYDLYQPVSKTPMSGAELQAFLMDLLGRIFHRGQ
jgi:D-alanyl-D-alanine dipeptidase